MAAFRLWDEALILRSSGDEPIVAPVHVGFCIEPIG